ncbi:PQQ-dependent sugar dehydrogenase [Streptomyces sp. ACA25]|uniref:PQQ-dependent sugar dehydrogenase n=1 Tax=Streptomyces sp. ACA25 TaxID=3022596 RepID=UPI002307887F|nr:PQQ-dependent sugar dehydrogenase [Streptomyces sp. ACA25]MDB1088378.1 PQQ-dependent sugar dehydrogenase [Streptomyces sp. ACA25]
MGSRRLTAHAAAIAAIAVLAAGCGTDTNGEDEPAVPATDGPPEPGAAPEAEGTAEVVGTVAEDLDSPWGLVVLPDGDLLVGSRDASVISRVDPEDGSVTEAADLSGVDTDGEGGLLGMAFRDEQVYAYHTAAEDNRIVRMDLRDDGTLAESEVVLSGIPRDARIHNGGGLAFGPDDMLYAGTGDANDPALAQDEDSLAGKILRMTPDGEPPEEGNAEPGSLVHSLGHRNVQGLAWDDDQLWVSEFGASEWDELNLIRPGGNYGWPHHEGSGGEAEGYIDPVVEWQPSEASPSGLAFHEGALWMAALRGERLWRIPLDAAGPSAEPQSFFAHEYGRLRTVVPDGDGQLLLVTNETDTRGNPDEGDDRILRVDIT